MSDFKELIGRDKVQQCPRKYVLALTDTLNVMSGKWKLPIIASLLHGKIRFTGKYRKDNSQNVVERIKRAGNQRSYRA